MARPFRSPSPARPWRPARPQQGPARGLTLIELMIALAVVGILAGIAYPNYRDYIIRGHLTDASNGLAAMRAQMERHFQDNRTYASVGTTFVTPCAAAAQTRTFGHFEVSCSGTPTAAGYTLVATGSGPVNGFSFTVNESDVRATTAAPAGWSTCATRWLLKRGASC